MKNPSPFSSFWKIIIVVALALGSLGTVLAVANAPTEAPIARSGNISFRVTNGQVNFSNGGNTYTVTNGVVALPAGATWYADLVAAGVLQYTTATGSAMFYGPNLMTVGTGAVVDIQSGSSVTLAGSLVGNPVFSGDIQARNISATGSISGTSFNALTGVSASLSGNVAAGSFSSVGDAAHRNITATGTISLAGGAFSGPIRYGFVASEANGAAITHGFASTPTVCVATPQYAATGVNTTTIGTIGATTFTVTMASTGPLFWMCGK